MKQNNIKTLLITFSTLALVACNGGGGGGSSGGDTPSPTPTPPAPVVVQPLTLTQKVLKDGVIQDGIPSLNKIGSHQVWYMIVKNPNAFTVNYSGDYPNYNFQYDKANNTPLNPTQYAMAYDGAISGITTDCLTDDGTLSAGKSCVYKFEAQWAGNTTGKTNFNFNMSYLIRVNGDSTYYFESIGCVNNSYTKCLSNNQNLQFNVINLSQKANDLTGYTAMNNNLPRINLISMDGSKYWDMDTNYNDNPVNPVCQNYNKSGCITNVYNINYNSSTNTYNKVLSNAYTGSQFGNPFSSLNTDGSDYYYDYYDKNGAMPSIQSLAPSYGFSYTYGLNGNVYVNSGDLTSLYLLNQNGTNSTLSLLNNQISENAVYGVNTNGNVWTFNNYNMYCYDATNNYTKTTMNVNGLEYFDMHRTIKPNAYYLTMVNKTDYFDLMHNQLSVDANYMIDFNNCQVNKLQYLTNSNKGNIGSVNQQFGTAYSDFNLYIESATNFSNGLNGGN